MVKRYHPIKINENEYVLYFPEFQELFEVNRSSFNILNDYHENNMKTVQLAKKYNLDVNQINDYLLLTEEKIDNMKSIDPYSSPESLELKINTTHNCNLECTYCYANKYRESSLNMTEKTADNVIEFINHEFNNFKKIHITFFGGEPFLNFNIIEYMCVKIMNNNANSKEYSFSAITNGTILSYHILEILKKYNFSLTISIDGPPIIHNRLRKFNNNRNTFNVMYKNVKQLLKNNIALMYEATYTSLHKKMNISKNEVSKYINEIGINNGYIVNVSNAIDLNFKEKQKFSNNIEDFYNEYFFSEALYNFANKLSSKYICNIGKTHFIVTPKGDLFPCQLFIDDSKKYFLGNVNAENVKLDFDKNLSKLKPLDKDINKNCKKCWARNICKDCPGFYYDRTTKINYDEEYCNKIRKSLELFLKKLYLIRKDNQKYRKLLMYFKKRKDDIINF